MGHGVPTISGLFVLGLLAIIAFARWKFLTPSDGSTRVSKFGPIGIVSQVSSGGEFDRSEWMAHPEKDQDETVRSRLAQDFVSDLEEGTKRSAVIEMIGPPDETLISESDECEWLYREDQYILSKEDTLHISYDRSDELTNAAIIKGQDSSALPFTNQLNL
jgi:hypothetical protein